MKTIQWTRANTNSRGPYSIYTFNDIVIAKENIQSFIRIHNYPCVWQFDVHKKVIPTILTKKSSQLFNDLCKRRNIECWERKIFKL